MSANSQSTSHKILNQHHLNTAEAALYYQMKDTPIKVLQIGEGNFLRGFFDWMIHQCNKQGLFEGSIAVTQPRPSGKANIEKLKRQDGLYTLVMRGIQNGELMEQREIISVFSKIVDPYTEWSEFLALAENPALEFVVSNTTEAGLTYQPVAWEPEKAILSYPGKLTAFLYRRFQHFGGQPDQGLIMLPCELLEQNGALLKQHVLQHSRDWELPEAFIQWIDQHNRFLSPLVDRIVTGYQTEAADWFEQWGYEDALLAAAEPYHIWAIEGNPELEQQLPFVQAGMNVHWVEDLTPFRMKKVRILNGAHTLMMPLGFLSGLDEVRQLMENHVFGAFVRRAVEQEILPTLPYDHHELIEYAESVMERFLNPYIRHRLIDISLNTISKFKVRLLPTLEAYLASKGELPEHIVRAFAGLIRFYKAHKVGEEYRGTRFNGDEYVLNDDSQTLDFFYKQWSSFEKGELTLQQLIQHILSNDQLWGKDLNDIDGLTEAIRCHLAEFEGKAH